MHELSIAKNILEIVRDSVDEKELKNIDKVILKIGEFSGVISDSLLFSLEAISADTELKNVSYEMKKIPFIIKCNNCANEVNNELGIIKCPLCGSVDTEIISGNELLISEIILKN